MLQCETIHPPEDDPYFQPMEIKRLRTLMPSNADNFAQYQGRGSRTKRNDGNADMIIKFKRKSFKVHKHVMRDASEFFEKRVFFRDYFPRTSRIDNAGGRQHLPTYNLDDADLLPDDCKPAIVDKVLGFAYTGHLPYYPAKDFLDFFIAAVALQFQEALALYDNQFRQIYKGAFRTVSSKVAANLISQSQEILKPHHLSECAESLGYLFDRTCEYIVKEPLDKLIADRDFLKDMTVKGMEAFLGRHDLVKPDEDEAKVLDLAMAWIKHDQKNRKDEMKKLLKKVHLGLLPRDRLTSLCSEVEKSPNCKQLVEKVIKLMDAETDGSVPLEYSHYQWFGNRSKKMCEALIGINPGGQAMVYFNAYGPERSLGWQDWCGFQYIPEFEYPSYSSSVLSVDDKLYVTGGGHYQRTSQMSASGRYRCGRSMWNHNKVYEGNFGVEPHQMVEEQDREQDVVVMDIVNSWSKYPPMIDSRRSFPMVHLDGFLYAVGGEDHGYRAMKESERYSFKDRKWEKLADLPVPCYYACATVYKGNILVYGSQAIRDPDIAAQHNLQMYNPATNQWKDLLTEHHIIAKYKKDTRPVESEEKKDKNEDEGQQSEEAGEASGVNGDDKDDKSGDVEEEEEEEEEDYWDYDSDKDLEPDEQEIGILLPKNVIIVDGEHCFRVIYKYPSSSSSTSREIKVQPVVHKLEFDFANGKTSVKVGEAEDQSLVPDSREGAFHVCGKVFINMRGCVHDTGIRIAPDQTEKVDLGVWTKLFDNKEWLEEFEVQFAKLKFDKRELFCANCVKGTTCINDEGY